MKSKLFFPFVMSSLLTQVSHAELVQEKLSWNGPAMQATASKSSNLQKQKKAEFDKKWSECSNLGKSNFTKFPTVKAWVLISWLRCSRELVTEKKSSESALAALKAFDAQPQLLLAGPWKSALWTDALKTRLAVLDQITKTKPEEAWKHVEALMEMKDRLDKSQQAKVFAVAGDLSQAKAQLKAAQFFYEQSLNAQETKTTREKLGSLLFALNETKPAEEKQKFENGKEAEGNFEERFQASQKANDLIALLEDCVAYLQKFPGGKKAKWAQERAIEIYTSFQDQSRDDKMNSLRERALAVLEKADSGRLTDWARLLHRRCDYRGSLRLSEKAFQSLSTTSMGSTLAYIAGRSAQLSGDYAKAKKYFEIYIDQFAGAEDLPEVYFRLGLVHLRMGQASSAIATFEKLLQTKGSDRYELNARYWLARSLQATDNTRALSVADEVITKYPTSYYGLRLKLERSAGVMDWPTPLQLKEVPKGQLYLTSTHKKALDRAQLLSQNGWIAEALAEVIEIPYPTDPQVKLLLAKQLNALQLFPPAIKLVNDAQELSPELRSLDVIRLSLPQAYKEAINDQAMKQKLSPYLVRSLIRQESAFGPRAISSSSAYGLMQLIGPTAQEVASEMGLRGLVIPDDVFVPENNIQMGTHYIAKMIRQFGGNVPLGLAAYNAGPQRMQLFVDARKEVSDQTTKFSSDPWDEMWFDEVPWYETSFYVKAILRNAILYQLADKAELKEPDQRRVQFGSVLWTNLVLKP